MLTARTEALGRGAALGATSAVETVHGHRADPGRTGNSPVAGSSPAQSARDAHTLGPCRPTAATDSRSLRQATQAPGSRVERRGTRLLSCRSIPGRRALAQDFELLL